MLSSDEGETSSEEEDDEAEMEKISADIENMLSNKKTTKQEWINDSLDQVKDTKFPVSSHFHSSFSPFSCPCGGLLPLMGLTF